MPEAFSFWGLEKTCLHSSVYMCVYLCIHAFTCVFVRLPVYLCVYLCIYAFTCVCVRSPVHMCVYLCICAFTCGNKNRIVAQTGAWRMIFKFLELEKICLKLVVYLILSVFFVYLCLSAIVWRIFLLFSAGRTSAVPWQVCYQVR